MACVNHPRAPTAATCKKCLAELCGICTTFLDIGEYCEKCASVAEAESYLETRNKGEEKHDEIVAQAAASRYEREETKQKERDKDILYIRGGIGVAVLMLFAGLGFYAYPNLMASDEELAQQQAVLNLEQCRQVFEAIGIMLSEGNEPDGSMSCPGTNIPNQISRQGGVVKVSHPIPSQYGLTELYVTSDSHRVIMI